jgi:hypothetical protein
MAAIVILYQQSLFQLQRECAITDDFSKIGTVRKRVFN